MSVRAAVQTGPRRIVVEQLDDVDELGVGEALLRIEASGMCGSDVDAYNGDYERLGLYEYPVIPGHEPMGRVLRIDDDARRMWQVDEGDRVAVVSGPQCGVCNICRASPAPGWRPCPHGVSYGFRSTNLGSGLWGGFSEVLHLLPGTMLLPLPDELSVQDCALFNSFAAGFEWVVRAAGTQMGDNVLILGPGQRGLASVVAAREAGADQVFVTGLSRDRTKLELARSLGATATIEIGEADAVEVVREATHGRGVERVIDTTPGAMQPVLDALDCVAWGGTIVLASAKNGQPIAQLPLGVIVQKALSIVGTLGTTVWSTEQAIRTIASGRYPLARLHSHTFGLDELDRAIQLLAGDVEGEEAVHITIVP